MASQAQRKRDLAAAQYLVNSAWVLNDRFRDDPEAIAIRDKLCQYANKIVADHPELAGYGDTDWSD